MKVEAAPAPVPVEDRPSGSEAELRQRRLRPLHWARSVSGSAALFAVILLASISGFLLFEGLQFFPQQHAHLQAYRVSGLELVQHVEAQENGFNALMRALYRMRGQAYEQLAGQGLEHGAITAELGALDGILEATATLVEPLREEQEALQALALERYAQLEAKGVDTLRVEGRWSPLQERLTAVHRWSQALPGVLEPQLAAADANPWLGRHPGWPEVKASFRSYLSEAEAALEASLTWSPWTPVTWWDTVRSFVTGRLWLSNSAVFTQFGLLPLLTGSIAVALIALVLAIPLGVAPAIYVDVFASPAERRWIRPYILGLAAFPTVVLGLIGLLFFGDLLRDLSQLIPFRWLPWFPVAERLNALTAGVLLALMAVPTIFSLSLVALQAVPREQLQAARALGASSWQTVTSIALPMAGPGIVSALLLALGRVLGETMIVLLCAGNRLRIPPLDEGLGALVQPVHTMTGVIAQELGEVSHHSQHYHALFLVGSSLLVLVLVLNLVAQRLYGPPESPLL